MLCPPCSMEEVETIAQQPTSIPISCTQELNLDTLLEMLWEQMGLVRALLVLKKLLCLSPGALALHSHRGRCLGYDTPQLEVALHLYGSQCPCEQEA